MKRTTAFAGIIVLLISILVAGCSPLSPDSAASAAIPSATSAPTTVPAGPTATSAPAPATSAPATSASTPTNPPASSNSAGGALVFNIVADQSQARYKVREQLAGHDLPNDAIGTTRQISGSIAIKADGSVDATASKFTVDVSTLATDQAMRDNFVKRNILETSQYPTVVFIPTKVTGLSNPLPQSGDVKFQITGQLTIKNTTKEATWDVTGTVQGNTAKGTATTSFKFEDFNIQQPKVPVVLSVVDNITLELDLTLQKAGG